MKQNQYKQVPRRGPDKRKVITDAFPESDPIFWGPNQRILEDDQYVEPSGFVDNRSLIVPQVVRFITDAHEEDATPQPSCTFEKGHLFTVPAVPVFSVNFRRVIGSTFLSGAYWVDWPGAFLDPSLDNAGRGQNQFINAATGALIITQPDITVKFPDGHTETRSFQEAFDAGHTEINFWMLWWRWFDSHGNPLGETNKTSDVSLNSSPIPGSQLLTGVNTDPTCPDDYFTGCPCLP